MSFIPRIHPSCSQSNNCVSSPPQALLTDVDIAGVLCTVGTNAGWRSKRSLERLGMLCEEKKEEETWRYVTGFVFCEHSYQPPYQPISNSRMKPVIKHLLLTDTKIAVKTPWKHQQKVLLEKYLGSNCNQCFEWSHSQVQPLLLLQKVSLTYLLWVLVLRRGQQLQWYSHFCLIRCLGMPMWK